MSPNTILYEAAREGRSRKYWSYEAFDLMRWLAQEPSLRLVGERSAIRERVVRSALCRRLALIWDDQAAETTAAWQEGSAFKRPR